LPDRPDALLEDNDGDGFSEVEGDCSDQDPAIHPDAVELCDGVDNDCDPTTLFIAEDVHEHPAETDQDWSADQGGVIVGNVYRPTRTVPLTRLDFHLASTDGATFTAVVYERAETAGPWELVAAAELEGIGAAVAWHGVPLDLALEIGRDWFVGVHADADFVVSQSDEEVAPPWGQMFSPRADLAAGPAPPQSLGEFEYPSGAFSVRVSTLAGDDSDADGDGFVSCKDDCDDDDPSTSPSGEEQTCDFADNDCDPTTEDCIGGLVITEVFPNPSGGGTEQEWFEVRNTTDRAVDLLGLLVEDDGGLEFVVDQSTVIAAGAYAIFADSSAFPPNGGIGPDFAASGLHLTNSGDELILVSPIGEQVDALRWHADSGFPLQAGASMSLDPELTDAQSNDAPTAWCISLAGRYGAGDDVGSPGQANPSCTVTTNARHGDVIVSEIMSNPDFVSDASGEWFELYNTTGSDVDLRGWTLEDDGDDGFLVTGLLVIAAGGRVIVARESDPNENGNIPVDYSWPTRYVLANGVDQVILRSPDGTLIDRVAYDDGQSFPGPTGRSISLSPTAHDADANDLGSNWCEATNVRLPFDYATPGAANDLCPR
jgi:hypothetical protein